MSKGIRCIAMKCFFTVLTDQLFGFKLIKKNLLIFITYSNPFIPFLKMELDKAVPLLKAY